ncbi:hypothetical protein C8J27_106185 [Rhodobacter aestuarii]|uniref:GpW protein n=1 Tax=Rhodobacter aestuarii TaxID=453582 RepID=A0A1N7M8C1_9RHOB|nr:MULTISPECIES: hypothetical protein [Rhodobacter]PTV94916.1 hypothetical protein C8J27_106185 [Rhodobacter aestuarii]SIS82355.1 hypothetical protein SAMN05421580_105185 [Rhodobacter aestuarii]SOC13783.1 hypothetical protein SAMN05877809_10714 [Rhodobacter sp. JA431]
MAWTQSDIDKAKANYAKGALKLRLASGEEIGFASGNDMLKRIRIMEAELAGLAAGVARVSYPRSTRGL